MAYRHTLVNAAGTDGWQLVVVGVLLTIACRLVVPEPARYQSTVAASVLTVLVTPAGLGLDWAAAPAVLTCAAIAYGGAALAVRGAELSRSCLVAAGLVGLFATAASLTRPGATALVLTAIVFAGVVIAGPRATRPDPYAEAVAQQVQETAAGGAAFALPGAVAIGLWALITERVLPGAGTTTVLAGGFLAVCGTLGYSAITQVARRRPSPTLLLGTTLGTGAVAVAALATPHRDAIDMSIGLLLFASAVLLWRARTWPPRP